MAKETSPAFQFYPKEYLSSEKVCAMSYKEQGMYWTLCSHAWLNGSIPADPVQVARLLGEPLASFRKHWPHIVTSFRIVEGQPDRLQQPRLEVERRHQAERRAECVEAGRRSAERRAQKRTENLQIVSTDVAIPLQRTGNGPATEGPTESNSPTPTPSPKKKREDLALTRERFERFWMVYPKKVGKKEALKEWEKADPDDALTDTIIAAVLLQAKGWDDPRFVKDACRWIKAARWEDESPRTLRINGVEQQPARREHVCPHGTGQDECRTAFLCDLRSKTEAGKKLRLEEEPA